MDSRTERMSDFMLLEPDLVGSRPSRCPACTLVALARPGRLCRWHTSTDWLNLDDCDFDGYDIDSCDEDDD